MQPSRKPAPPLQQDEEVEFEIADSPKGLQAVNVVPKRLVQAATKYPPRNYTGATSIVGWSEITKESKRLLPKKSTMPEIAYRTLDFMANREDELGRLTNYEILICRIDDYAYDDDEGVPYLLSNNLIDIPDPDALTYRITPSGRSALHAIHLLHAVRDLNLDLGS